MILKYDEAMEKAENKDWFKSFYKREDCASDEEVDEINALAKEKGEHFLNEYLDVKEDILLQKMYVDDVLDYLEFDCDNN